MRIVTYNIHYAIGKDERYDLARVVEDARGSDHQPVWIELAFDSDLD